MPRSPIASLHPIRSVAACLVAVLLLGLAACTDTPAPRPSPTAQSTEARHTKALAGSAWTLAAFAEAAGPDSLASAEAPADSATAITAHFTAEGRLAGTAGCNRYTSAYTISGDTLRLGRIAHTRRMCPPLHMRREQRFITALPNVHRYRRTADSLVLLDPAGIRLLTFAAVSDAPASRP